VNRVWLAWLATSIVGFALWISEIPVLWMLDGLILFGWGLAVATNYRGVAQAFPRRTGIGPFWQETSPAMTASSSAS
jgi:hypothetical protein